MNPIPFLLALALLIGGCSPAGREEGGFIVPVTVEPGTIHGPNTPCEAELDFGYMLEKLGVDGTLDRLSIEVEGKDPGTREYVPVDYRVGEHFRYGVRGKVFWNIENPAMTEFRVKFDISDDSPARPRGYIPAIGVGDEIMYNTPEPTPLVARTANLLADYDGDGITDVLAINHYSDRFGWPYDGILFYPGTKEDGTGITVGDFYRIRYVPRNAEDLRFLHARYNWVCPVDWDEDGRMDLLYISIEREEIHHLVMPENHDLFRSSTRVTFLRNTGETDISGLPVLKETKHYPALVITHKAYVPSLAAEDLDGDGRCDLIGVRTTPDGDFRGATVYFYRNIGNDGKGIPELAEPVVLKTTDGGPFVSPVSAHVVSFGDVNGDGRIDIIYNDDSTDAPLTRWCENMGGSPPVFGHRGAFKDLPPDPRGYRWVRWGGKEGLLGTGNSNLLVRKVEDGRPVFVPAGGLSAVNAPLVGGMQEKPEWIDWDGDGDMDLLAGESRGRLHLYRNTGTRRRPKFSRPEWIEAGGERMRIYRDGVFGGKHWHGAMGYPSVACVDWDMDGLFDLLVPNETNRVYWFRNTGKPGEPEFEGKRQILPDGFTDSREKLERTRRKALKDVYALEEDIPFYWRTRLAVADYTGDGLDDLIAVDGMMNLVLYERYRDGNGKLRLKHGKQLYYDTGDPIEKPHFIKLRNVDWDGDGLIDIAATQNLFSRDQRSILLLRNAGTPEMPVFERPRAFRMWERVITYSSHGLQPSFIDWDGDGTLDFVGATESGFFVLFRNAVLKHSKPIVRIGLPRKSRAGT